MDDEAPARFELRYLLDEAGDVEIVGEAASAGEAMRLIGAMHYDVVFLDIEMPGISGVRLAETLAAKERPPAVVFVTAYSSHAVKAFEIAATDYLVKPVRAKRLRQTIDRLRKTATRHPAPRRPATGATEPDDELCAYTIPVRRREHTLLIAAKDLLFAAAYDNYSQLYTEEGRYLCSMSLLELQERLVSRSFLRVHRRYLVNLGRVRTVTPQYGGGLLLTLDDPRATSVPVSRRRTPHVRKALGL